MDAYAQKHELPPSFVRPQTTDTASHHTAAHPAIEQTVDQTSTDYHRFRHDSSILTLAISSKYIYAGTQSGEILVFGLQTFERLRVIQGHNGSILCLSLSVDEKLLFSGAGDRFVNVWDAHSLKHLSSIYSTYDIGDVFCVAYSAQSETIYIGCQNTSIQWCTLHDYASSPPLNRDSHPSFRKDKFFDSSGPGGIRTPRRLPSEYRAQYATTGHNLEIPKNNVLQFAHYGYVYCMLFVDGLTTGFGRDEVLISGGGDGAIKLWGLNANCGGCIHEIGTLENEKDGGDPVLAIAVDETFLYSGRADGEINVWDLETRQLLRILKPHSNDILTLSAIHGMLFAAAVDGTVAFFDQRHELVKTWKAHKGMVLASGFAVPNNRPIYITGGNDSTIALWDATDSITGNSAASTTHEHMVDSLKQFVAFQTISADPRCKIDSRRAASWLRSLFRQFGGVTELLKTDDGYNPIVFARFRGKGSSESRKKILFYGHYDVVRAGERDDNFWTKNPFSMEGMNGYLYGRGTSDNKGPIMAALYAVAELVSRRALNMDIVFIIEGEEECGSRGFKQAIQRNKSIIGDVDWILLANSYWLDDEVPCLTYGLRGVIHATVEIQSDEPDLHSGVDGSSLLDEPLKDLVRLLASLTKSRGQIDIPGFYDEVLPVTEHEKSLYDDIARTLLKRDPSLGSIDTLTTSLIKRWAEPALTLHGFKTSGPQNSTIIPRSAHAALSIRVVPNQEIDEIAAALISRLHNEFDSLGSKNHLKVAIGNQAEPWLGDYNNQLFKTLEQAIMVVWNTPERHRSQSSGATQRPSFQAPLSHKNPAFPKSATSSTLAYSSASPTMDDSTSMLESALLKLTMDSNEQKHRKPLYIREGGSIPAIRFLEKEFDAPAAHLPCGQASDNAHLDNERFRLVNLYKSKEIFQFVFSQLPKL